MRVSLCVVALNEEKFLPSLLRDIRAQTYPHEKTEVVLIDSMSGDGTEKLMLDFRESFGKEFLGVQVLKNEGRTQSCGWNKALVSFSGDAVIRVDAHSHIPEDFIEKSVEALNRGEAVVGGARPTRAERDAPWADTLLLAEESMFGSSISSFRRSGEARYVNSLFHGAYRREVFQKAGGFREDLGRTEDNEMHYRIRQNGYRIYLSPDIISYQYIRPTLRKMCRQKYGNGYWIGKTLGVCPQCLSLYHFVPAAFVGGIFLTTLLAVMGWFWPLILMWALYWLLAAVMAVLAVRGGKKHISRLVLPGIFFLLHISYGAGTWIGLIQMPFWRRAHRECESVQRVRRQMKERDENGRDEKA